MRLAALLLVVLASPALAQHPAPGQPDPYITWKRPGTYISCCNLTDCQAADDWRPTSAGYEVLSGTTWYQVPPGAVLTDVPHPGFGDAHVCISGGRVVCFLPGAGL